jgi:site-specific DNA-cytosine methylase
MAPQNEETKEVPSRGIDALMHEIEYLSHYLDVDTKDYYLPQTRQRGYMLCVKRSWFGETYPASKGEKRAEEAEIEVVEQTRKSAVNPELEEWAKMMEALKHKVSVPAEVMLLAASEETKKSVLLSEESGKDVPCDKCRLRHEGIQDKYQLANERKLTRWKENGGRCVPGFWITARSMMNQVMDFLEVLHLLSLMNGIDDCYHK